MGELHVCFLHTPVGPIGCPLPFHKMPVSCSIMLVEDQRHQACCDIMLVAHKPGSHQSWVYWLYTAFSQTTCQQLKSDLLDTSRRIQTKKILCFFRARLLAVRIRTKIRCMQATMRMASITPSDPLTVGYAKNEVICLFTGRLLAICTKMQAWCK